jgi:hypothetical protein
VEGLLQLSARQRQEFVRIFRSLAENPFQRGDIAFKSSSGREIEKKRFGSWLVSYWPDHPVKELRVVGIQRARS